VGAPCRGCFGGAPAVFDPGAKMVAAIASTFDSADAEQIAGLADAFVDLAGTLYRYTLPAQCAVLASPPPRSEEECDGCRR
jgi:F420-non-reducing hydrogenase small subunit